MRLKVLLIALLTVIIVNECAWAQDNKRDIKLEERPLPEKLLPYSNPMMPNKEEASLNKEPSAQKLDGFQKDVMQRISEIYKIQVKAVQAEVNEDPLNAEKHITDALNALQGLLDQYPEVQSQPRFSELYRSVMTEYRQFYGVSESANDVEGEIFKIQKDLYSGDTDWDEKGYSLPKNITTPTTEVPMVQNREVNRHLMYYSIKRPNVMEVWLKRKEKYFPMMRKIFEDEGAPVELIHMSMIESGLNPEARSWASAVGMWQFIQATGSMYGLEVNWWIDERRDPEKATRAAARHLKDLYNVWHDWHLAIANYNISPRGLKRALRRAGEEDYWAALDYLPRETQGYVPGFIAATMIEKNPTEFGFKEEYPNEIYDYQVYRVAPLMPLDKLAEAAGISLKELKKLNPELLRWATPPGSKYPLKLPVGTKKQFASNYDDIPKDSRSKNVAMHTVNRGETLGTIARKYGTSVRALYQTNENLSNTIYPGQKVVVPLAPGSDEKIAVNSPTNQPRGKTSTTSSSSDDHVPDNSTKLTYTVKSGNTVGHIAEWYDVRSWQVRTWNGTSNTIRPGDDLVIYVPESKESYYSQIDDMSFSKKQKIEREQRSGKEVTDAYLASASKSGSTVNYTVRSNDTLIKIANSFGVSVNQIKRLNNLNNSRIYVGQKLNIKAK